MSSYVIAVKRGLREKAGPHWSDPLSTIQGLRVVGDANPYRLRIEATESAIAAARQQLARLCHIEEIEPRYVLGSRSR